MDTRERLIVAALALLEERGEGKFSTRAACARAKVTAPTLYHHFKDADGLVSAAVMLGFSQFIARKLARPTKPSLESDLLAGWDDYVSFARKRPKLYAAMTARVLQGASMPAADAGRTHLLGKLERLAAERRLALPVSSAVELVWATAHAAALLWVSAAPGEADARAVAALRTSAKSVLKP